MHEFKEGKLRSSSGDIVSDRKQAIAIGMSYLNREFYKSKKYLLKYDGEKYEVLDANDRLILLKYLTPPARFKNNPTRVVELKLFRTWLRNKQAVIQK